MLLSLLFSLPADCCFINVSLENEEVALVLRSNQTSAVCPACTQPSTHVHGHYTRRLSDLPCQGKRVQVSLLVRRFACRTKGCPRTTFAEPFPELALPHARRTLRQMASPTEIAFALGGKGGAHLTKCFSMPTSRDTLLRLIRNTALPSYETPCVLSTDDFAWKKGNRYGTLLIDLQAHCPVDVLPDREATTVARWLRQHPGVRLISRDRAGGYAEGAKRGAPRARQNADRYHLLVNLRDALKATLARHQNSLPMQEERGHTSPSVAPLAEGVQPEIAEQNEQTDDPSNHPPLTTRPLTAAEQRRQISRANRLTRYEQIRALHLQGLSERAIAQHLRVSRKVVHRFATTSSFPERAPSSRRPSKLDPYLPYLRQRWEQGCQNGLQLAREITAQGFCGSVSLVCHLLGAWRAKLPAPQMKGWGRARQAALPPARRISARQASWLFVKPQEDLTSDQLELLTRLCQAHASLPQVYQLGQEFVSMVKQRQARKLDVWLKRAEQSASTELRGFVGGIRRDYAAVKAALSLPWSHDHVA